MRDHTRACALALPHGKCTAARACARKRHGRKDKVLVASTTATELCPNLRQIYNAILRPTATDLCDIVLICTKASRLCNMMPPPGQGIMEIIPSDACLDQPNTVGPRAVSRQAKGGTGSVVYSDTLAKEESVTLSNCHCKQR